MSDTKNKLNVTKKIADKKKKPVAKKPGKKKKLDVPVKAGSNEMAEMMQQMLETQRAMQQDMLNVVQKPKPGGISQAYADTPQGRAEAGRGLDGWHARNPGASQPRAQQPTTTTKTTSATTKPTPQVNASVGDVSPSSTLGAGWMHKGAMANGYDITQTEPFQPQTRVIPIGDLPQNTQGGQVTGMGSLPVDGGDPLTVLSGQVPGVKAVGGQGIAPQTGVPATTTQARYVPMGTEELNGIKSRMVNGTVHPSDVKRWQEFTRNQWQTQSPHDRALELAYANNNLGNAQVNAGVTEQVYTGLGPAALDFGNNALGQLGATLRDVFGGAGNVVFGANNSTNNLQQMRQEQQGMQYGYRPQLVQPQFQDVNNLSDVERRRAALVAQQHINNL